MFIPMILYIFKFCFISISLDSNDPAKDLSHVLDFLCHVKYVQVCCQYLGNELLIIKQNILINLLLFLRSLVVLIILGQVQ
jgi:hypothetical protein